ncbi:hypothetical protein [Planctomicrobium piriforme]|uniref:Uncharacterized protein n=1 Tax=Planctomicrobium piriforme TaxID=1576369 RepID=A0A1I3R916_9PLAN|nr:hypothetical protein [Planctomicrobium piriforme]SFJ43114.1 hypothetical protein SAMN05421753_12060 [Planctomicrobium piriforme]
MTRNLSFLTGLAVLSLGASVSLAQHHHHHGGGGHYPTYHGSHYGHSNWNYVVPHQSHYSGHNHGTYYVQGNGYYYTPTAVVQTASYPQTSYVQPVVQQPVQLQYGGFANCEDLAGRLEVEANNLCLDLYYNYQGNPGYKEVYREAYQILQAAKFAHASEHQGNRDAIRRQVAELDQLFHHVQAEVATLQRQPNRQIGLGGVIQKSTAMEAILHHLAYTVGVEPHSAQPEVAPPPGGGGQQIETAPPPVS